MARCLYRIVMDSVLTLEDFIPAKMLGKPLFDQTMEREWAEGVSFFSELEPAQRVARRFPKLGSFLTEVCIPDDLPLEIVQTGADSNHYTVYAEPKILLSLVRGTPFPIETGNR